MTACSSAGWTCAAAASASGRTSRRTARPGHARVGISHFDLGRLPKPLVPRAVAALGKVDLDADVRFSPARLRGRLAVRAVGTGVDATFDVPASWPPRNPEQPLRLALTTPDIDLGALAHTVQAVTGHPPPVTARGRLALSVNADGRAGDPHVNVAVRGRALAVANQPLGDVDLSVEGRGDRPIALRLNASGAAGGVLAGPLQVAVQTSKSLRALLRHPPSGEAAARMPFEAHVDLRRVSAGGRRRSWPTRPCTPTERWRCTPICTAPPRRPKGSWPSTWPV